MKRTMKMKILSLTLLALLLAGGAMTAPSYAGRWLTRQRTSIRARFFNPFPVRESQPSGGPATDGSLDGVTVLGVRPPFRPSVRSPFRPPPRPRFEG